MLLLTTLALASRVICDNVELVVAWPMLISSWPMLISLPSGCLQVIGVLPLWMIGSMSALRTGTWPGRSLDIPVPQVIR